ncbi:MAG: triple tyrosine motif-containing protein [Halioglobus sp.]
MKWNEFAKVFFLSSVLICASISAGENEQLRLSNSSINLLLSQLTINSIQRGVNGFLWIGTADGLYEFDGVGITKYSSLTPNNNWIPSNGIRQIEIGDKGEVWIATDGAGIAELDPVTGDFFSLTSGLPTEHEDVIDLEDSGDGYLWFRTANGRIGRLNLLTRQMTNWLASHPKISDNPAQSNILKSRTGEIWFGGVKGLYHVRPGTRSIELYPTPTIKHRESKSNAVTAIAMTHDNFILMGTAAGNLHRFDVEKLKFDSFSEHCHLDLGEIQTISTFNSLTWIGGELGLKAIDEVCGNSEFFQIENSVLSDQSVLSLLPDYETLWVGTFLGLDHIRYSSFEIFNERNSGVDNDIQSFTTDSSGRTWIGTYNGLYYKGEKKHHPIASSLPAAELRDLRIMSVAAKEEELWLGYFSRGIQVINLRDGSSRDIKLGSSNNRGVTTIYHTASGTTWVGTVLAGLFQVRNGQVTSLYNESPKDAFSIPERKVLAIFESKNRSIYIGTENGAYEFNSSSGKFTKLVLSNEKNLSNTTVMSISQDFLGRIWLGTKNNGIFVHNPTGKNDARKEIDEPEYTSSLPHSTVYAIEFDDFGYAWISTTRGLLKLNSLQQLESKYTVSHGLQGEDFNFGASYKDLQGRLYFGGSGGYNRFKPSQIDTQTSPPQMVITDLVIAGEEPSLPVSLQSLKKFQLSHSDYFFTITFSALDFLDPSKNQYSYKLEGFDSEWIDNGTRNSATYTNLPAGEYNFRVRGANSVGVWNLDGASIEVQVLPAPWFSWWAKLCYTLAALVAIRYARKIYDDRLIAKNVAVHAEQMRHAADRANDDLQEQLEIQDALVRSVYKHNMSTLDVVKSLHSVRAEYFDDPVTINASKNDENRLIALSYLESCVLYQDEVLYANLKKFTDMTIGLVLKSSDLPIEAITTINDVTNKMVPDEIATPLALVIFELLDNCVSHAFQVRGPANYIQVSLQSNFNTSSQSHEISLVVSDDGVGLPSEIPDEELESTGLAFVRSVIKKFHGEMTISDRNPGTRVEILLPNTPELKASYGNQS